MAWLGAAKCVQSAALVRGEELAELSCPLMLCRAFGAPRGYGVMGEHCSLGTGAGAGGSPTQQQRRLRVLNIFYSFFSYKHVSS